MDKNDRSTKNPGKNLSKPQNIAKNTISKVIKIGYFDENKKNAENLLKSY